MKINKKGNFVTEHLGEIIIAILLLIALVGVAYFFKPKIYEMIADLFVR